jgi:caffeoyl-CoA O-methyltransferase
MSFFTFVLKTLRMEFISEEIDNYVCAHTSEESELLYDLNRKTHLETINTRMISGHFQGRVLSMLSKMIQPKRILEIGTFTGYSALCLAEGLQADGKLITIDINEELEELFDPFFAKSEQAGQLEFLVGDALEVIPTLSETFDLVFIDADKQNYQNYYDLIFDKVVPGGYILIDNVLWSGKVTKPVKKDDVDTPLIQAFNDFVQNDTRVENVLFPIRDGLLVVRKKGGSR